MSKLLKLSCSLVAVLSLVACKVDPASSELSSGFAGADCASARKDLEVQAPKLAETKKLFLEKYEAFKAAQPAQPGSGLLLDEPDQRLTIADGIKSEADCNTELLKNPGTDQASSVYQDVYQRCIDYYRVYALVKAREDKLDTTECKQGADQSTIVPVFISSCDSPCQFTSVECGLVELDANGSKRRFACGTTRAAVDAAKGYCREFSIADAQCKVAEPVLKPGKDIAMPSTTVAGSNTERVQLQLEALGAGVASAEYTGGVVASVEGRIEFKAQGIISLELNNEQRAVRAGEFIAAGTEASCKMTLTGFVTGSAKAFVGVGGSFKVFGNGVEAKAGVEGAFSLALSKAIESNLGKVQGGGLDAAIVLERCIPLAKAWLQTNVAGEFKPFADRLSQHVDEFKEAAARAAEAAFGALSRGEESVDTKGRIFCETNVSATFSSGNKIYRINSFAASVGQGKISLKAVYEGSINPFTSTASWTWDMNGNGRGRGLVEKISAQGVSSISDDDIRWLLTDVEYSSGKKFINCDKSGF